MRTMLAVLGGAVIGCSDPMGSMSLDFAAEPLGRDQAKEWAVARTRTGDHRVAVRHQLRSPGPCEEVRGELLRTGNVLTIRILAPASGGEAGGGDACGYTATIHGIPSGRYALRVVHTREDGGHAAEVVLDHPLHVR